MLVFARPKTEEGNTLARCDLYSSNCKLIGSYSEGFLLLSTVALNIEYQGEWIIEKYSYFDFVYLLVLLDYKLKINSKDECLSNESKDCQSSPVVRYDKGLFISLLKDEIKNIKKVFFLDRVTGRSKHLEPLFNYIRNQEVYWVTYHLLTTKNKSEYEEDKLNDIIKRYGLSESQFRKLCKNVFNRSPKKQLRLWRASASVMSIIDNDNALSQTAFENGFSSSSHLGVDIKSLFGFTPSEIKKLSEIFHD